MLSAILHLGLFALRIFIFKNRQISPIAKYLN